MSSQITIITPTPIIHLNTTQPKHLNTDSEVKKKKTTMILQNYYNYR